MSYQSALKIILDKEGGYSNNPADKGGETYRGISRKNWPNWNGWQFVDQAKPLKNNEIIKNSNLDKLISDFYFNNFYKPIKADDINNKSLRELYFDTAVNSGINTAVKILQKAANLTGAKLAVDGLPGPLTIKAVNQAKQRELFNNFKEERNKLFTELSKRPGQNIFAAGWQKRLSSFVFRPEIIGVIILFVLITLIFKNT